MSDGATASWRGILRATLGLIVILSGLPARSPALVAGPEVTKNDPPIATMRYRDEDLSPGSLVRVAALQRVSIEVTGFDPDGDPISFSPIQLPKGASWTANPVPGQPGGIIVWRPSSTQTGTFPVQVDFSSGADTLSLNLSLQVLAPATMVTCTASAPGGTLGGETLTLTVDAPTAPGAALLLILGPELNPPLPLSQTHFGGTSALAIDPALMTVLFNGVSLSGPPPFAVPFSFATPIPPGLDGWSLSVQAFVQDQSLFFSSPVTNLTFGDPSPLGP